MADNSAKPLYLPERLLAKKHAYVLKWTAEKHAGCRSVSLGKPESIGRALPFLASDEAQQITGALFPVG